MTIVRIVFAAQLASHIHPQVADLFPLSHAASIPRLFWHVKRSGSWVGYPWSLRCNWRINISRVMLTPVVDRTGIQAAFERQQADTVIVRRLHGHSGEAGMG